MVNSIKITDYITEDLIDLDLKSKNRDEILVELSKLLEKSNPACITDLQAGVDLSHIGINMGKSNVKANLPLIKDEKIVKNFKKEIENL